MIRIVQKRLFHPTLDIRLTNDDFIEITHKRLLSQRSFKLDLRDFDPHSSRQKSIPRRPVTLMILFTVFFLIGLIPRLAEPDATQMRLTTAIIWGSLVLIAGIFAWFGRSDLTAYFSRYNGSAVLTLYHGKPDAASFGEFARALDARLRALNPRPSRPEAPLRLGSDDFFSLN